MTSGPTLFISYSHDSDEHREAVLALSERLRADGIETILDRYVNGSPDQGWPRWMLDQLDAADFVLVVCTPTYYRRYRGVHEPGRGKGVDWEGALITQEIYDSHSRTSKFVPVFFAGADEGAIPEPLRSHTHYALTSDGAYQSLYDFLLGQANVVARPVGALVTKPRRKGTILKFDQSSADKAALVNISRIIDYAPEHLFGRDAELALLSEAWAKVRNSETKRTHVLTFVALGGEGKTSLVAKWAADLAHRAWPACDAAFAWSFYSQGTREREAASSDLFLKEALSFFGDSQTGASSQTAFDKGRRLAELVGQRQALLILDGLEPLQCAPSSPTPGELKDQGLASLVKGLAAANHGLCVVTTRYSIPELRAYWQTTAPETKLLRLSNEAGVALLRSFRLRGTQRELERLVEDVKGHALTLNLVGAFLRDAHAGDSRKRDLIRLEEADTEEQGGHAFRVIDAYVRWFEGDGEKGKRALGVLRQIGFFDRPISADCLAAMLKPPPIQGLTQSLTMMGEAQLNLVYSRLESAKLLTVNRDLAGNLISLDAHPLLREYFARQVRTQHPKTWRVVHRRLYKHLCSTTPDKPRPRLEDLQPLYEAVAHGCQAGMQQDACDTVFQGRILRGTEAYSTKLLGALGADLGAIACFFDAPWTTVSSALSDASRAWMLNEAAFRLRALGRLTEALKPMRAAVEMRRKQKAWWNASATAGNLSELEALLGLVAESTRNAELAVKHAKRSGDAFQLVSTTTIHADILHRAGRRAEAEARFREAESLQHKAQPVYPLLYAINGFRYCGLLLAPLERSAWQCVLKASNSLQSPTLAESCRAVTNRAAKTLVWAKQNNVSLLSIALDHLSLARAALCQGILERSSLDACHSNLQDAIDGIRGAGTQHWLPTALLTRAWLRYLTGARIGPESAHRDLEEAWETAEGGPMPLLAADVHLHRARLFGVPKEGESYPWESPHEDLKQARRLIQMHGYGQRREELEDAEVVARSWLHSANKSRS